LLQAPVSSQMPCEQGCSQSNRAQGLPLTMSHQPLPRLPLTPLQQFLQAIIVVIRILFSLLGKILLVSGTLISS
jgi:hypothetical protein